MTRTPSRRPLPALAALLLLPRAGAFGPGPAPLRRAVALRQHVGSGGMADTRDPAASDDADPRKSISAAPSFEEYLKQRDAAAAPAAAAPAAVAAPAAPAAPAAATASGALDAAAAVSLLDAAQTALVAEIAAAIPDLAAKPDQSFSSDSGFAVAGHPVRLAASDAPGPANVAWLSDLGIAATASSLTVYAGPLTDVPHLLSRCVVADGDTIHFFQDFRPRGYGAYELRDEAGKYPGPETLGRKAFEYSGNRKEFDAKFGTEEVAAFFDDLSGKFEGAIHNGAGLSELEKLTRGPLALDATMPLSANNVNAILAAREKAVSLWLSWALDTAHDHRPGAPINAQYVYDSKFKINSYGALLDVYVRLFGQAEGEALAAAESGPIDEAYVGGGS